MWEFAATTMTVTYGLSHLTSTGTSGFDASGCAAQELLSLAEDGAPALLSESFDANSLALWRTPLDGPPEEWAPVAEVPLKCGDDAAGPAS